jgi:hypothetical protein
MGLTGAGCLSMPLGTVSGIDPATQQQLSSAVPLYDSSQLPPNNFIKVGMVTAYGCDNAFLGGAGRNEVIAKVRQQAQSMGANGITDLSCDHADPNGVQRCFSATACTATALKILSTTVLRPDAATN